MIIHENNKGKAITLLILLSLIWGTSFILMKRGLYLKTKLQVYTQSRHGLLAFVGGS